MYRLHGKDDWGSLAVHMALEEIGAPFEFVRHNPDQGDLARLPYVAMNPFGLIPVLETPDGALFETAAILLYLADKHGGVAPAPNDADRGAFLVWLAVICQQLHPNVLQLLHPYRLMGEEAKGAVAAATHARLLRVIAQLETRAAGGDVWLSGARASVLAVYAAMLLRWWQSEVAEPALALQLKDYPALHAMAQTLEARPAIARVLAREGLTARGPHPLSAPPPLRG